MIDDAAAKKHVARMSGLDFFPSEAAAVRELVAALKSASGEATAKAVVDEWIRDCRQAPKPADMRRLIAARDRERAANRAKCEYCNGDGAVPCYVLVRFDSYGRRQRGRRMPNIENDEQADRYRERMEPDEELYSAAYRCTACTPPKVEA